MHVVNAFKQLVKWYAFILYNLYLTRQGGLEQILIYNDGQTWTTLGQLCAALWDSHSRPDVMQPAFEPGTAVTPLALGYSALDHSFNRLLNSTYIIKTMWIPARRTSHSKIIGINMEMVPPLLL
jgi:hypothetical protein